MIIYIVSQIVEKHSEIFVSNAVMLIIKPIEVDKNKISHNFFDYNPGMSWLVIKRYPK